MLFIDRRRRNRKGQEDPDKERQFSSQGDFPGELDDAQRVELHGQSQTAELQCGKDAMAHEKDGSAIVAELHDEQRAELPAQTRHGNSGSQMFAELPAELPAHRRHRESR